MSAKERGLADLLRSGLTAKDAKQQGLQFWEASETRKKLPGHSQAAIFIPYYDLQGKVRDDVFRCRFLDPGKGFLSQDPKWPRYGQPAGSPAAAYFPRGFNWASVARDPKIGMLVTEGEKKAIAIAKGGAPCIGLGGVWNFANKKVTLPELVAFDWKDRKTILIYDSDCAINPDIQAALRGATAALGSMGAKVYTLIIPSEGDRKMGADDFLVAHGEAAFVALLSAATPQTGIQKLWEYNQKYAVVKSTAQVFDAQMPDMTFYSYQTFEGLIGAADRVVAGTGKTPQEVTVASQWLKWPLRTEYEGLTYEPGQPSRIGSNLNHWRSLGVGACKGCIEPWILLLDHLFAGSEPVARQWFERWAGWPLRHLGAKLLSAAGVWSQVHGVGKSAMAETLRRVYGDANAVSIKQKQIDSDFNGWAVNKQFVVVDDISEFGTRQCSDTFKKLITQEHVLINKKFVSEFSLPDHCNYLLTSNHANAFYLDEDDRRFFVHEVLSGRREDDFWDRFFDWRSSGGLAALLYYFQETLDYGQFNPKSPPPMTQAKAEMIGCTRTEVDAWIRRLPDIDLDNREIWTPGELSAFFNTQAAGHHVSPTTMASHLKKNRLFCFGQIEREGTTDTYWAVKHGEKWQKATREKVLEHIKKSRRF